MPTERRAEKLNVLLREELSKIVDREVDFSEDCLATITRAAVSPDGRYAKVFFTVFGGSEQDALARLEKQTPGVQRLINRKLRMRPVPKIRFLIDEEEMRREAIEKSLAEIKKKGEM
ncbi:MAG: 30S ribosome-binding factor RbfA [Candidatus Sungbacteria bacterium]|nr:30S ribosome-binding factor RbfA [Candidatus Sungbacteria bacterium]